MNTVVLFVVICACIISPISTLNPQEIAMVKDIPAHLKLIICKPLQSLASNSGGHQEDRSCSGFEYGLHTTMTGASETSSSVDLRCPESESGFALFLDSSFSTDETETRLQGHCGEGYLPCTSSLNFSFVKETQGKTLHMGLHSKREGVTLKLPSKLEIGYLMGSKQDSVPPLFEVKLVQNNINVGKFWMGKKDMPKTSKDSSLYPTVLLIENKESRETKENLTLTRPTSQLISLHSPTKKLLLYSLSWAYRPEGRYTIRRSIQLMPLHMILDIEESDTIEYSINHQAKVITLSNQHTGASLQFRSNYRSKISDSFTCTEYSDDSDYVENFDRPIEDIDDLFSNIKINCARGMNPKWQTQELPEGYKRIQETIQSFKKEKYFDLRMNMTVDKTDEDHYVVSIFQNLDLPVCPALGWTLQQIFDISPAYAGWEYVVSEWAWGNMVVKGKWGSSILDHYQKTFTFSFDQDIEMPGTTITLDFQEYEKLVIIAWPSTAYSIYFSVEIKETEINFKVYEKGDFWGNHIVELVSFDGSIEDGQLSLFDFDVYGDRIAEISMDILAAANKTLHNPKFCGNERQEPWSLETILTHLIGYGEDEGGFVETFWKDIETFKMELWEILEPLDEIIELRLLLDAAWKHLNPNNEVRSFKAYIDAFVKIAQDLNLVGGTYETTVLRLKVLQTWKELIQALWAQKDVTSGFKCCQAPSYLCKFFEDIV